MDYIGPNLHGLNLLKHCSNRLDLGLSTGSWVGGLNIKNRLKPNQTHPFVKGVRNVNSNANQKTSQ